MDIMSKTDAINCALNEGLPALKKHLQTVADVANGGVLSDADRSFIEAATSIMTNQDCLDVARMMQKDIEWRNLRIRTLEEEREGLLQKIADLEVELNGETKC